MSCISHLIPFRRIKNTFSVDGEVKYVLTESPIGVGAFTLYANDGWGMCEIIKITSEQLNVINEMLNNPVVNTNAEDLEKIR